MSSILSDKPLELESVQHSCLVVDGTSYHQQHGDLCFTVQLEDNLKSLELLPKLTPEVMDKIDAILNTKPDPAPTYGR